MAITHTVYQQISPEELARISQYSDDDIVPDSFRDPKTWGDLKNVLIYHPDPIVRHEASFVVGEIQPDELIGWLYGVVKFDSSIVATHEAIEALGRTRNKNYARRLFQRLTGLRDGARGIDERLGHPDVQATFDRALSKLTNLLAED